MYFFFYCFYCFAYGWARGVKTIRNRFIYYLLFLLICFWVDVKTIKTIFFFIVFIVLLKGGPGGVKTIKKEINLFLFFVTFH